MVGGLFWYRVRTILYQISKVSVWFGTVPGTEIVDLGDRYLFHTMKIAYYSHSCKFLPLAMEYIEFL